MPGSRSLHHPILADGDEGQQVAFVARSIPGSRWAIDSTATAREPYI